MKGNQKYKRTSPRRGKSQRRIGHPPSDEEEFCHSSDDSISKFSEKIQEMNGRPRRAIDPVVYSEATTTKRRGRSPRKETNKSPARRSSRLESVVTHSSPARPVRNSRRKTTRVRNTTNSPRFRSPPTPSPARKSSTRRKRSYSQLSDANSSYETNEISPTRKSHRISERHESVSEISKRERPNRQANRLSRSRSSSVGEHSVLDPHLRDILAEAIRKLRRKCDPYGFFSKPVDPEDDDCSDYYDIVSRSEAMCFNTIEDKFQSGDIRTINTIKDHIQMIINCARKYNTDEDNFVRIQADVMMSKAEPIFDVARKKWKDHMEVVRRKEIKLRRQKHSESNLRNDIDDESYSVERTGAINGRRRNGARNGNNAVLRQSEHGRRTRRRNVAYADVDSIGSEISDSDYLKKHDSDEFVPIEGSEIPFAKPMLVGSTISACNTREEWVKICPKLATVCNEAARRSTLRANPSAMRYEKPLSETYIKERLDYDNPLDGFVIRTNDEFQHIQGFIVATCFKTWRKTFRFAFDESASLITPVDHRCHRTDKDGSLTAELQKCEVEEIENGGGYRFPRICEISLLGGLACGGALLSRTLSEIRQSRKYDYCVLQSTKIAIPFYEKHGFVRIGAVCKFNDKDGVHDVAYRHWSEIVNSEAVEPSYMMARRLQRGRRDEPANMNATQNSISDGERIMEIRSALQSAHYLLTQALNSRVGSLTYALTYREMISSAREFALSADDLDLVRVIDEIIAEFSGSHFGSTKMLIKQELRMGVDVDESLWEQNHIEDQKDAGEQVSQECTKNGNGDSSMSSEKVVKVVVVPDEYDYGNELIGKVTNDFLEIDDFFPVKVILDNKEVQIGSKPLSAKISRFIKSGKDIIEAGNLAVDNIKSFVFAKGDSSSSLEPGDRLMLRTQGKDGSFMWVDAAVEKKCKIHGEEGFTLEWESANGKPKRDRRILNNRNRGIGKDWCTELDWASFFVLPTSILDAWLIGSSVQYLTRSGKVLDGMVSFRKGGGMENFPSWRVEIGKSSKKKGRPRKDQNYAVDYLGANILKEMVEISESNLARVRAVLRGHFHTSNRSPSMDEGDHAITSINFKPSKKLATLAQWVQYRISKFDLLNFHKLSEEEKSRSRQSVHKVDDLIIHMRTGVQNVSDEVPSIPTDVIVPRKSLKRKAKSVHSEEEKLELNLPPRKALRNDSGMFTVRRSSRVR
jgi:predicted GNAT family N-acyltransferase